MVTLFQIATETENGLELYRAYLHKSSAERVFKKETTRLQRDRTNGAVTMYENHSFVKEYVQN